MLEDALEYLRSSSGPGALVVLFLAAALEYMLPFVPGDTIVLAGSLLVIAGRYPFATVYAVAVAGGFLGSLVHYLIGRALVGPDGSLRGGRHIERVLGAGAMDRFFRAFQRYGLWVIALNRAMPGVRAACFLAAGAAGIPAGRALAAGLVSNLVWSAGLLLLGVSIGNNLDNIQSALGVYQGVAAGLLVAVVVVVLVVRYVKKKKKNESP